MPGRSFHVTSMPPSGRSVTPPFSRVGTSRGQQRHDVHLLVGDRQPLDDAGLDVFEDVRAEAVQRVGLAVVADDQQFVRRRRRRPAARAHAERRPRDRSRRRPRRLAWSRASSRRHDPRDQRHGNRAVREQPIVKAPERERRPVDALALRVAVDACPSVPSQYISAVPGNIEFLHASPRAASRRACRPDRDRAQPLRRSVSVPVCRPMSTTARASSRARVCCWATDSSRREEPAVVHQIASRSTPTLPPSCRRGTCRCGWRSRRRRCGRSRDRAAIRVVVLHVMPDRAVMHDVVELDDARVGRAQAPQLLLARQRSASIGVTT